MIIKNQQDLNKALASIAEQALREAQDEVHACIENFVRQYYSEYSPVMYKRTYQFMNSITKTKINKKGSSLTCMVFIDVANLDYINASGQEVVDMINKGYHAMRKMGSSKDIQGTKVWDESIEFIDKYKIFIDTFKRYLIDQGFDVLN